VQRTRCGQVAPFDQEKPSVRHERHRFGRIQVLRIAQYIANGIKNEQVMGIGLTCVNVVDQRNSIVVTGREQAVFALRAERI
jgi:hypothetical protein